MPPQLPHDFLSRFQIGLENCLFLISFPDKSAGIHIDRGQCLGALDDDVAARPEPHPPFERFGDFFLDRMLLKQRRLFRVEHDFRFQPRHKVMNKIDNAPVVFRRIDDDLRRIGGEKIADRAHDQIEVLMDQ